MSFTPGNPCFTCDWCGIKAYADQQTLVYVLHWANIDGDDLCPSCWCRRNRALIGARSAAEEGR